mmetsp:Transcript_28527/g.54442  ORF Transcript_28527/g.54442 Transcript_28527/m.54442 type:complete len:524 (-) Transcript_28527:1811-3382(-)
MVLVALHAGLRREVVVAVDVPCALEVLEQLQHQEGVRQTQEGEVCVDLAPEGDEDLRAVLGNRHDDADVHLELGQAPLESEGLAVHAHKELWVPLLEHRPVALDELVVQHEHRRNNHDPSRKQHRGHHHQQPVRGVVPGPGPGALGTQQLGRHVHKADGLEQGLHVRRPLELVASKQPNHLRVVERDVHLGLGLDAGTDEVRQQQVEEPVEKEACGEAHHAGAPAGGALAEETREPWRAGGAPVALVARLARIVQHFALRELLGAGVLRLALADHHRQHLDVRVEAEAAHGVDHAVGLALGPLCSAFVRQARHVWAWAGVAWPAVRAVEAARPLRHQIAARGVGLLADALGDVRGGCLQGDGGAPGDGAAVQRALEAARLARHVLVAVQGAQVALGRAAHGEGAHGAGRARLRPELRAEASRRALLALAVHVGLLGDALAHARQNVVPFGALHLQEHLRAGAHSAVGHGRVVGHTENRGVEGRAVHVGGGVLEHSVPHRQSEGVRSRSRVGQVHGEHVALLHQ